MAPPFLTSAVDVGERSASRPGRLTPWENPLYPLVRRLGGPQSRSGRCGEEKKILSCRESNQDFQPEARRYTD
jgi:hypothetical protein